jgi:hypothetical protein
MPEPITIEELVNAELKDEALQYKDNQTLELYRMILDRRLEYDPSLRLLDTQIYK